MHLRDQLQQFEELALKNIQSANDFQALDEIRIKFLGKKGHITLLARELGKIDQSQRREYGTLINNIKDQLTNNIQQKKELLEEQDQQAKIDGEQLDLTLPFFQPRKGSIHPISLTMGEAIKIFENMGFKVKFGPDIEDDFHNFTALNFPKHHPARNLHDTFFLKGKKDNQPFLLRTHTSPSQIRTMLKYKPPHAIISAGRTFRCDSDQTHTPMFHQIEGLVVDTNINMGHLVSCLNDFIKSFFNISNCQTRLRPHYFPFTEPSAEMDVAYSIKNGKINFGSGDKWMEILGCGMVHPNVLKNCGHDPDKYSGFAFGIGLDRLTMLKYGITDLRDFFTGDIEFLSHYNVKPFHFLKKSFI